MTETSIIEELKNNKTVIYFTVGKSMEPLLKERKTHVIIKPASEFNNKDIVLYLRPKGAQVLHRLIKQDEKYLYMRGDNTMGLERITREQAVGVVQAIYRKDRYIDVSKDGKYKAYVNFWLINYPFRLLWHKMKSALRRLLK